jgi:arabinan endo-1,5-alpha-L-arabinosidase
MISGAKLAVAICLAALAGPISVAMAQETQSVLGGDTGIHDPTWVEVDGVQVAFGTGVERAADGGAIRVKTAPDGLVWTDAGSIGQGVPDWVEPTIGSVPPNIWAPHAFVRGERIYLYYAVSTFGVNVSALGLMTHDALDPADPTAGWVDRGVVLTSSRSDNFNAIDAARIDTPDGKAWLSFGSWWDGIKMREIDPESGKLIEGNDTLYSLASRGGGAIEAPSILAHDGKYYLFVSFDLCCRGVASTYNIRVGRADAVTGPYLDRDGKPMMEGGGTLVLAAANDFRGPGGQEAFATPEGDILVFHYYSIKAGGAPRLQIAPIRWTDDGWPEVDPLP